MGWWEDNKPVMAMLGLQFSYAAVALTTRSALLQGMSPRVFVVYRQAIATLVLAPIAYFSQLGGNKSRSSLGMRSFSLIFVASLIGYVTINQNIYFEGLYLASSSIASAMGNLVPAITFLIAALVGFEKVNIRSLSTVAKILGTIVCVSGAVCMAFAKGPKLLNTTEFSQQNSLILHYYSAAAGVGVGVGVGGGDDQNTTWMMGCLLLFGSCCCWSFWLILQVPMSASCPDHLCLSTWMCFFATIQSAILTFFLEPDPNAWRLHSSFELLCALYSGVVGSALSFFVQAWCISLRGPLFSAMFNPLCTVIVTILACLILHEELYTGSLVGAFAVVAGLYVVLWGKAKDLEKIIERDHISTTTPTDDSKKVVNILIQDSTDQEICKIDLEEPLLAKK
ncbi:Drug/metabolite transporter [Macleaya cordata]|uniref:WAT1-related protein n=1 Tax=Macleaya cordata TaxID=56857 RepID=A0A200Q945_MACCD|nr:Drug/metabolite transporter [Macleaya cordata]